MINLPQYICQYIEWLIQKYIDYKARKSLKIKWMPDLIGRYIGMALTSLMLFMVKYL